MTRHISPSRKAAFYVGMALMIIGGILFASTFVTFIGSFGEFAGAEVRIKSAAIRGFGGFVLFALGAFIRSVGAFGGAGSGVVLDPSRARRDLEPFSRMAGGILKDALEETEIELKRPDKPVVMIRCRDCGKLNEDDSKFCQECGQAI